MSVFLKSAKIYRPWLSLAPSRVASACGGRVASYNGKSNNVKGKYIIQLCTVYTHQTSLRHCSLPTRGGHITVYATNSYCLFILISHNTASTAVTFVQLDTTKYRDARTVRYGTPGRVFCVAFGYRAGEPDRSGARRLNICCRSALYFSASSGISYGPKPK